MTVATVRSLYGPWDTKKGGSEMPSRLEREIIERIEDLEEAVGKLQAELAKLRGERTKAKPKGSKETGGVK